MIRVLIVGNGPAAVTAAETVREHDADCSITLVSKEAVPAYSPCPLAEYVEASVAREHLFIRDESHYSRLRLQTLWGHEARALDASARRLTVRGCGVERQLEYDRLLIATGARAVFPPIPGLAGTPGVFALKTLADAESIITRLPHARRAVVIGAGFIGLEAAQALARRGLAVTLVEALGQILPQMVDAELAARAQRRLETHGVAVRTGSPVQAVIAGRQGVAGVKVAGVDLPCELVVCAAGVRPDLGWLAGSGVATATGVLVDEHLHTSVLGVWAAGDVVEGFDPAGRRRFVPNWPNAVNAGRAAGHELAGVPHRFRGLDVVNVVRVFDVPVASFGSREGERTLVSDAGESVRKLTISHGRIVGGQFLGDVDGCGLYRELMHKRVDVSPLEADLLAPGFGLGALMPRPRSPVSRLA